jgi:hypothetical protein
MPEKPPRNYTAYQQKVIRRYYDNQPDLLEQQLAELIGTLYLAEGKKKEQLWKRCGEMLRKLGLPPQRVDHLLQKADPKLIAELVRERQA